MTHNWMYQFGRVILGQCVEVCELHFLAVLKNEIEMDQKCPLIKQATDREMI